MKKLILVFSIILNSIFSFSQVLEKVGDFYDGEKLMKKDSSLVSELIQHYDIDTTGLTTVQMWEKDCRYCTLTEQNYGVYHSLVIKDGEKKFKKVVDNSDKEKLNKYIVICEHDLYNYGKVINVIIF